MKERKPQVVLVGGLSRTQRTIADMLRAAGRKVTVIDATQDRALVMDEIGRAAHYESGHMTGCIFIGGSWDCDAACRHNVPPEADSDALAAPTPKKPRRGGKGRKGG